MNPPIHFRNELTLSRRQLLLATSAAAVSPLLTDRTNGALMAAVGQPTPELTSITLRPGRFRGAPDGHEREIWGYNGQLPGPMIRAKLGQTLRIKMINDLRVPTTIHWHGMHQPGTWRMDGVGDISQKPVPPGAEFIYEFKATPAGTHWYHSHVGVQYGNGLFGPLIIEDAEPIATYDREEVLQIHDWFWELGDPILARLLKNNGDKMPGMRDMKSMKGMEGLRDMKGKMGAGMKQKMDPGDVPFQSGLINGKGRPKGKGNAPLTTVDAKKGETIRLRLINSSSTYALRFQVDGHPLTVIASDGNPVQPVVVDNLVMGVGESYDVLLKADQDGVFWIRAITEDGNPILAVLRYAGAQRQEPEASAVRWGPRALKLESLRSREPVDLQLSGFRDFPFNLGGSMMPYRWSINGQFFPQADPLVLQKDDEVRCVFNNATMMAHPFHLHGHSFYVLGKPGALNFKDPPLKDTINVPPGEKLVIQWKANNPGQWFFHCHIEWHLEAGMARVWQIKPY
ncbi:multicopper oxidase family protein [soil metagenome]